METATALESVKEKIERKFYATLLVTYGGYSQQEAFTASQVPYDKVPSSISVDMIRAKAAYEDAIEIDPSHTIIYGRILQNSHELQLNPLPVVRQVGTDRLSDPVYNLLTKARDSLDDLLKDSIEKMRSDKDITGPEDIDVYVGTKGMVLDNLIASMDGIPVDERDNGSRRYKMTSRNYSHFLKMSETASPLDTFKTWLVKNTEDTFYEF